MHKEKAALNLSPLTSSFVNWPALASNFCVNLSKHPPRSLLERLYFMASHGSDAIYLPAAVRKDKLAGSGKPAHSDSCLAGSVPFYSPNLLMWVLLLALTLSWVS